MGIPVRCVNGATPLKDGDVCVFYKLRWWRTYPFITRTVIRRLYKHHGWNTHDGSFELQAVINTFKTVEEASAYAKERGWGVVVMPLNAPLPNETCQYGYNDVPDSNADYVTVNRDLEMMAVPRRTIMWTLDKLQSLAGRPKAAP